ncbi:GCN5-related N-acetyltransferase [Dictyostelium discoideum AX4]|uniref:GCN5-related N-acetyltransferase n=1 Tax=Dictyostelium discoideum TaxID=44689 RepID=Q54W25_DICDI|nr:GCN5-related N-acetyltransferase [Dictyostelium discoideum AX4]EAL67451.1 GCN5-related N-acetyltransferase [Dictyostelium discoideum AX4]|eukprot:XP_641425.1 GCN5-related N-acetyltransferase [Dictyostelium discoideum AX4]
MEMFTLLKDSSISPTPSSTSSSSSSSSSTFFSNCKRKSISSSSSPSTMTTKTMNILPANKKLPALQIVPDKDNCENESDQEIELNKCNKKLKLTSPPPSEQQQQQQQQQPEVSKSQPIDNFKMYKEIQEKHVKEWDWKAAAQVHYSDNVHSKFLKPSTKSTNKSTNKSSSSSSSKSQTSITTAVSTTIASTTPILEQTVIDAGQKNVGQMVCSKCKMLYSYGSKEDEAAHQSFCNGNIQQQKVIIKNWQSMKIVNTFPNGRSIIVVTKDNISNNSALSSKINLLKEIINIELGYASPSPSPSSNVHNNNKNKNDNDNDNDNDDDDNEEKLFLYLDSNGRVLGCLIAERVEKGYKIESSSPTIQCSKVPTKILCGINRIWVLPSSRKRGIASKLMESLASNMYYCYHLKKHEIATTQPSTTGLLFFNNYFKTNQFLLYNINQ